MQYRSIEKDPGFESHDQSKEHSRRTTLKVEISDEVIEFAREVLLMDRGGAREEADQLIMVRAKDKIQRRSIRIRSQVSENGLFRTRTRKVASAWNEQSPSPTSTSLTGPSGIRFALSREEEE